MNKDFSASIIARETLRQLASLKISPTPDNYHKLYEKIAGNPSNLMSPSTSRMLSELVAEFPRHTPELLNYANKLEQAIRDKNWHKYKTTLLNSIHITATPVDHSSILPKTIHNSDIANNFVNPIRESLAQILGHIATMQLPDQVLTDEADLLALQVRKSYDKNELKQFIFRFEQFCAKFKSSDDLGFQLQQGLLRLIKLLIDNIAEFLSDDQWIRKQLAKLRQTISIPLNFQVIEQAESYLEEMLYKQDLIKQNLCEAKITLKQMVTSLIGNIEELSESTGEYHDKIESYSTQISQIDDIVALNKLLVEIMQVTRQMQVSALNSRDDFLAARAEVDAAQSKIQQLESDLLQMGEKVCEDHLTGILNRRGLDHAFERESARAILHQQPLSLALLDIDDFKQLNDTHGHKAGDEALVYLVKVIKEITRPKDVIARFGGEEFVLLLPDTHLEEAKSILSRIRRSLTRLFFLQENKRLLITFSAGITAYQSGELQESTIKRADKALYCAKKSGKNRIIIADL